MVRFLKGTVRANRWLHANKEGAIDFLAKEIPLRPELALKGWEYYTANRIWLPNAEISPELPAAGNQGTRRKIAE